MAHSVVCGPADPVPRLCGQGGEYALHVAIEHIGTTKAADLVEKLVAAFPGAAKHALPGRPLPLYRALEARMPRKVVVALADAFPAALTMQHYVSAFPLPLHRAMASAAPEDIVLFLIERSPETVKTPVTVRGYVSCRHPTTGLHGPLAGREGRRCIWR